MKIKVLVIAPYQGLSELIKSMEPSLPEFDITIHLGDLAESLKLVSKYKDKHVDFIISRGGTAKLLKEHTSIPVIEVEVSGYDSLRILTLLKSYEVKIEMIGFKNVIQSFEAVSNLIDIDLTYTVLDQERDVEQALETAKKNGARVVVGDTITARKANEIGLQGVLITSGKESVKEAFDKARDMYKVMKKLHRQTILFKQLLNHTENGYAILNKEGFLTFSNGSFDKIVNVAAVADKGERSLFEAYPFFENIITLYHEPFPFVHQLQADKAYEVNVGMEHEEDQDDQYFVELSEHFPQKEPKAFTFKYYQQSVMTLPQMIMTGKDFRQAFSKGQEKINTSKPVLIIGEIGTGKKSLVHSLYKSIQGNGKKLIEVQMGNVSTKVFNQFIKVLEGEDEQTMFYLNGLEKLSLTQQQKLVSMVCQTKAQLVFSFEGDLDTFYSSSKADQQGYKEILKDPLYLPSIRERLDELEKAIQAFIVQFNEKYGKQVVGVRKEALEFLRSYPWNRNYSELREVMERMVKEATGEFIGKKEIEILQNSQGMIRKADGVLIDLSQTLEQIEKSVISTVMEQENLNQSKVAKRLGINRSTLWRKLKSE